MRTKKERLKYYFTTHSIDAKKLNEDTGIQLSTCYRIVNEDSMPSYDNLKIITDTYTFISLTYLIRGV